jgi:O-antigen ligase
VPQPASHSHRFGNHSSIVGVRSNFRRSLIALTSMSAAALLTLGFLVATVLTDRGVAYGTGTLSEIKDADIAGIGANTFLHREPNLAKVRRELEVLRGAGIGIIRQEFNWAEIEPIASGQHIDAAGRDSWAKYDHIVAIAEELGIEILARLDRAPGWATPGFNPQDNPSVQAPPADYADFASFAERVAARYRGKIRYYQIWNEPNLHGEWGGLSPNPSEYLDMLRIVGQAIRAKDAGNRIVLAGLAPTIETGPDNLSDLIFLRRLYELGARGDFDVAASMAYGLFSGPRDIRIAPERTNFPRSVLWREIMLEFGDFRTPIWAAEYGWMSLPDGWAGDSGIWGNHPIENQAAWTVDGIQRAREQWPWMPTIIIWASRWPEDVNSRDPTPFFRLMDKDFTPRPSLLALRRSFASTAVAGVGLHQESHPAISYRGPWPRVPSDLASLMFHRQTGISGAGLEFRFEGTDVALLTRRGPDMGRLLVRIDGQDALADAVPRSAAGEGIIDLYSDQIEPLSRVQIATRLPPGRHELEISVQTGSNPRSSGGLVIVDGLFVGNGRPILPWFFLAGMWFLVGGICLWALAPINVIRRLATGIPVTWMDRKFGPFRTSEILIAVAAILYAVLPSGGITSVWTAVRLVLALGIGLMAIARVREASFVAVASIPFVGVIGRTGVFDRPVSEILIVAVVGAWIVRSIASGQVGFLRGRWLAVGGYFVLASIAAAILADFPKFALRDLRTVILEPIALFFVLISVLRDRRDTSRLLTAFVGGASLCALVALVLVPAGSVVTEVMPPRLRGTFGSPNNLALVLERSIPIALALVVTVRTWRTRWTSVLVLLGGVLILTWSRGAWAGALIGVAMAAVPALKGFGARRLLIGIAGFGAMGTATVLAVGGDRLAAFFRFGDGTVLSRLSVWDAAWRMIGDHWVFGLGPDNFLTHYRAYMRPEAWREPNISHPHNLVFDAWLSTGIFGLVALLLVVVLFWTTWTSARYRSNGELDPYTFGIGGAMLAMLVHGLVDHSYFLPELATVFWVLIAAVVLVRRSNDPKSTIHVT